MRHFKFNKAIVSILLIFTLLGFASGPFLEWLGKGEPAQAVGGYIAVNGLGQLDGNDQPLYTTSGANNAPNQRMFVTPYTPVIDTVHHRLFVPDGTNFRVLEFDLDSGDQLIDRQADHVLGQSDMKSNVSATTQSGMGSPFGLAYDSNNDRLFVADASNNRVLVFDVATITDGEPAIHELGQAPGGTAFTSGDAATTQGGMSLPIGLFYDIGTDALFVADSANNRVLVFDLSGGITDGMNASNELGQNDGNVNLDFFDDADAATSQGGMNLPAELAYDSGNTLLFVSDKNNNRVLVFDLSGGITDGMNASNELGQPDDGDPFDSDDSVTTQDGMSAPWGLAYDSDGAQLFVADSANNRVLAFDLSGGITDGMPAFGELGQPAGGAAFTSFDTATTQGGMDTPIGLVYSATADQLYVSDQANNRVMIFDGTAITNGADAIDLLGHLDENDGPVFTSKSAINPWGIGADSEGIVVDTTDHRLFVADPANNRVLLFNLTNENALDHYVADNVLCQDDFNTGTAGTTQDTCSNPTSLAYDAEGQRLFVGDTGNNRVLIFDVSGVTNGQSAANEFGQNDTTGGNAGDFNFFNDNDAATTQSGMDAPRGLVYDPTVDDQRLFVADTGNNRVLVFDMSEGVSNGMDAANEVGQPLVCPDTCDDPFITGGTDTSRFGMDTPVDVEYDSDANRLFVADSGNNRILVFDVSAITNGMDAANELGQVDDGDAFDSDDARTTQDGLNDVVGVSYDTVTQRLFVGDTGNNRVLIFGLSGGIIDGMGAANVIGQTSFTSSDDGTAQNALSAPTGVTIVGNSLFVSDAGNNRILEFDVEPPATVTPHVANDLIGQLDDDGAIIFSTAGFDNGPNKRGFFDPDGMVVDEIHHRLFVVDSSNHRVLEFDLDVSNHLLDRIADHVLGRENFKFKGDGLSAPHFVTPLYAAYDAVGDRLFVSDFGNNRVLVFDTADITNEEDAVNVIGQPDFTSDDDDLSASGMDGPRGVAFDPTTNRLFVGMQNQQRVLVFNVDPAVLVSNCGVSCDGPDAINVIGQPDFNTDGTHTDQSGFGAANNLILDPDGQRLFVDDSPNNRIMIFDVDPAVLVPNDTLTDDPDALNVLGQSDFTSSGSGLSANEVDFSGFFGVGLGYDTTAQRLFVADTGNNRVLVFDVDPGHVHDGAGLNDMDGESASSVLGQSTFTDDDDLLNQSSTRAASGLSYDGTTGLLYVSTSDDTGQTVPDQRVMIFDVTAITDGEPAVDLLGQLNPDDTPNYTSRDADNGPNHQGFKGPTDMALDTVNHHLFVADHTNNRVLVFDLDTENHLPDHDADFVLGQPDFKSNTPTTTQSEMQNPTGVSFDQSGQRLFVVDNLNNRVLVFDLSGGITNGMLAANELGQPAGGGAFTDDTPRTTQSGMDDPRGVAYDSANDRLFVVEQDNNRVLVFDMANITNGEDAVNVLGQADFSTALPGISQNTLTSPVGAHIDETNERLYVADQGNHRLLVFDTGSISDGMNASDVFGQSDYGDNTGGTSDTKMNQPSAILTDPANDIIWVADTTNNRVMIFTSVPAATPTPTATSTPGGGGPVDATPLGIIINNNAASTDSKNVLVTIRAMFSDSFVGSVDVLLSNDPNFSTYIPYHYSVENSEMVLTQWPKTVPWDMCFGVSPSTCNPGNHKVYARFYFNVPRFSTAPVAPGP